MGKAAVILVAAVTLASTAAYMSQDRQALEQMRQEALYEHQVLAREIAQSGFNRVESRVRRDFENHRLDMSDVAHAVGSMDLSASGASGSAVTISSTGKYEGAEYTITGVLSRQGSRILDALTVDAGVDDVGFRGNAKISGLDTNPDGSDGPNQDVHAVLTTTSDAYNDFTGEMEPGDGVGVGGLEDVTQATPEINLATLGANILDYSGAGRVDYSGDTDLSDQTVGSVGSPAVLVVDDGDLTLSGSFVGHGILYVDGALTMEENARWEGLVMVENDGGAHILKDGARIYGAAVVRSVAEDGSGDVDDQGLPGGHFDVDVFDEFGVGDYRYHEHKYDDDYDVTGIDLLDPNRCENGGLCWQAILGQKDAVYVEFINPQYGYGTYNIQAGEGSVTETCNGNGGGNGNGNNAGGNNSDDGDASNLDLLLDDIAPLIIGDYLMASRGTHPPSASDLGIGAGVSLRYTALAQGLFSGMAATYEVCHNGSTKSVGFFSYLAHLFHGDSAGACSDAADDSGDGDGGNGNANGGGNDCGTATIPAVDLQGNTHEGLSATLVDSRQVSTFQVNFQYLCALQISSPNGVIYDPTDRNDAFTIRVYEANQDGVSLSQGDLIYETSVYHHTGYGWWDDPGGTICDPLLDGGGDAVVDGGAIQFDMEDNALIQYSSQALLRVKDILSQVNPGQGSITLGNVRENGERQRERPTWLGRGANSQ